MKSFLVFMRPPNGIKYIYINKIIIIQDAIKDEYIENRQSEKVSILWGLSM